MMYDGGIDMKVNIKLADKDDFFIIKNFIPLFRHYIGEVYNELPNKYGVFSYDESKTLQEMCDKRERWIEHPDEMFPYIISAYDRPVGYMLVARVKEDAFEKSDYYLNALFIVSSVRRKGIAGSAVRKVFDDYKGKWEVHTNASDRNIATQNFWNKTIKEYTGNKFDSCKEKMPDGDEIIIYRFNSNKTL